MTDTDDLESRDVLARLTEAASRLVASTMAAPGCDEDYVAADSDVRDLIDVAERVLDATMWNSSRHLWQCAMDAVRTATGGKVTREQLESADRKVPALVTNARCVASALFAMPTNGPRMTLLASVTGAPPRTVRYRSQRGQALIKLAAKGYYPELDWAMRARDIFLDETRFLRA